MNKLDSPVVVLYLLESCLCVLGVLHKTSARDNFKEVDEQHTILKVFTNIIDLENAFL